VLASLYSYVLLECRCETSRDDSRQIAAELHSEASAVPYQAALTVFARRHGPLDGRIQLFCTTADRPPARALDKRDDYVRVATLHDVEVRRYEAISDSCLIMGETARLPWLWQVTSHVRD